MLMLPRDMRYYTNDCSVPVTFGHKDISIRGYVDEVVTGCRGEVSSRQPVLSRTGYKRVGLCNHSHSLH
jgi:hypothetical protein